MSIIGRFIEALDKDDARQTVRDEHVAELAAVKLRLETAERIGREYFEVIERMERERDEWKDRFFIDSAEHQQAQDTLNGMLGQLGTQLRAAISQLNIFRDAAGLKLVVEPKQLDEIPSKLPDEFRKRIAELTESVSPQTDGKAERERIAATAK